MCFGCCCFPQMTQAPNHFVGKWTNGKSVHMRINHSGKLHYIKRDQGKTFKWNGPVRYSDDGFSARCCFCCSIEGTFNGSNFQQPTFTVNGDVLIKDVMQDFSCRY